MHICGTRRRWGDPYKLTIIGSDNGLLPGWRQAIIWTNAGILLIGPLGTNFSKILIAILTFLFRKMSLKESSAKWRPFSHSLNVLTLYMLNFSEETKNIYLHFISFLHIDMTQVVEILPQVGQERTYSTQLISWVPMSWRGKVNHDIDLVKPR